jgi:1-deoxy-D-xylulose-5-phosphate reductoisomerase
LHSDKKKIAILGSTGSIGTQALEVIAAHADVFEVEVLTAQRNADLLIEQARSSLIPMPLLLVMMRTIRKSKSGLAALRI